MRAVLRAVREAVRRAAGVAEGRPGAAARGAASKVLTMENINPKVLKVEYAVRGPVVLRALQIAKDLKKGKKKPFTHLIRANIGDAHAMGQLPITFLRQVLALVTYPDAIPRSRFPMDVKRRACAILADCGGYSVGSYSNSNGLDVIRQHVAKYISKRDGYPSNPENVFLTGGASSAIKTVLKLFVKGPDEVQSGIMVPIPQYPLYSATLAEFGLGLVGYYLDEDKNWGLNVEELERAYCDGCKTCMPRGIVIINPGNPTGQVLKKSDIESVIKFAHKNKLLIFADEVYQHNIYAKGSKFYSFKKVMMDLGEPYSQMELASFNSVSKGYAGECGLRGGYGEVINFDPEVQAQMYKTISVSLCSTVLGQAAMDCVVKPPDPEGDSYELWLKEKNYVLKELGRRAKMTYKSFNKIKGFKCNEVQGAMYAFPKIELPPKAIEKAKEKKMTPDLYYAYELLEKTGIVIVPGSGFGQRPGTHHFRTTILPPTKLIKEMLSIFQKFHADFTKRYS